VASTIGLTQQSVDWPNPFTSNDARHQLGFSNMPFQSSIVNFFWHKDDMTGVMYGKFDSCAEHVLGFSAS